MTRTHEEAAPISLKQVEGIAWTLREMFDCTEDLWLPVTEIIEFGLPSLWPDYSLEIREEEELGNRHAYALPDERTIVLRQDVYEGMLANRGRDRMTAMHEFAHLVLHQKAGLARRVTGSPPPPYRDPEWQAKCLAGALMAPGRLIPSSFSKLDVASECGVSVEAANYRLKQITKLGAKN